MSWVRHTTDQPAPHKCAPPTRGPDSYIPTPDGQGGDLWRCDHCRDLWRIADACGWCDAYGHGSHGGQHQVGLAWRPATLWQRIRHRR